LKERKVAFMKLEGHILMLKKQYETVLENENIVYEKKKKTRLSDLDNIMYFVPPIMDSSCPIMGSVNMFNGGMSSLWGFLTSSSTDTDKYGSMKFKCQHCNYENTRPERDKLIKFCQSISCRKDVTCGKKTEKDVTTSEVLAAAA